MWLWVEIHVCPCVRYLRIFPVALVCPPHFPDLCHTVEANEKRKWNFCIKQALLLLLSFFFWGCVCLSVCRRACCLFACLPLVHHQAFQLPPRTAYIIKHHRLRIRSVRHQIASVQTPRQLGLFFRYSFIFAFRFQAACLIMRSD